MMTDAISSKFASVILERDAKFIAAKQEEVVRAWNLFNTGKLEQSLKGHFSVANIGAGAQLTMRYLAYARLMDITLKKKRKGFSIYNKIVFGVLYNRSLMGLKYGFTKQVKDEMIAQAEQLAKQNTDLTLK